MTIAGHTFSDGPNGLVCVCGKRKLDVLLAHKDDIDQPDWAHVGNLSKAEYEEIDRERERLWELGKGV
jgi:hypothetical protein